LSIFLSSIVLSSIIFLFVAGCQNEQQRASLLQEVEQLTQEKAQLQEQVEQAEAENERLKGQVQVLSGLPEEVKLESIRRLKSLKVGRFTGFYDKDKDGKKEKLIVYIEPMDEEGDKIKAAGSADVQLWDLNKSQEGALLGQWHVTPDELRKAWFDTLLSTNYRCVLDITGKVEDFTKPLTVKVAFTDYLSGRTFTDQRAIKPASQ
jgi:outer membrane murein-binding lipoprotein Lpp